MISGKFSMCGPVKIGRAKNAGSRMLCPPRFASDPPMNTTLSSRNKPASSPIESSNSTPGNPQNSPLTGNWERRTNRIPFVWSFPATTSNRSGFRGTRINSRFGCSFDNWLKASMTASSSSMSPATAGGMVLAAIQTEPGRASSRKPSISAGIAASRGWKSYLRFPLSITRSGGAPRAMYRSRLTALCARIRLGRLSTWRKNHAQRR